jgi:hypothetical protein
MTTKAKVKPQPETPQLPKPDNFGMKGEFKLFGGSLSDDFNVLLLNQATNSLWTAHSDEGTRKSQSIAAAAAMTGAKPTDELEGMLVAQMVAAHSAAMECYRRAMLPDQTFAGRESNLRHAVKLSRVYADLVLALDKHRGKGEQRVTVEHVHVHKGGQAIVGTVQAGGGMPPNSEDRPHAPALTHEPSEAMSSEIEAVREAVPIPRR